jgi:hypothetical protein
MIAPPGAGLANSVTVIVDLVAGIGLGLFSYSAPTITPNTFKTDTVGGGLAINGTFFGPFFISSALGHIRRI